jgi:hypothetical protein
MASEAALTSKAAREIAPHLFPQRTPITEVQINAGIECCLGIQRRAVTFGKRPFAAVDISFSDHRRFIYFLSSLAHEGY